MNKIFIVDDDEAVLKLYTQFLELKGFDVIGHAKNGMEAIEKYLEFRNKPDLIIMDYHMPIKNGVTATKEILKINGNVKIFMISGDITIKTEALAAGAIGFKKKPFRLQELQSSISMVISNNTEIISSKIQV
jgi:DNA-binding NarL/FixJ family response regulator